MSDELQLNSFDSPQLKYFATKYNFINTGNTVSTVNYQRPSDYKWIYQEPILPGQTKTIWAVPSTLDNAQFFDSDIVVESKTDYVTPESGGGCTIQADPGFPTIEIMISSTFPSPPQIKVQYYIVPFGTDICSAPPQWTDLSTSTPSQCPTYASFGIISSPSCFYSVYLRFLDTSNRRVNVRASVVPSWPNCPFNNAPGTYNPCLPNTFYNTVGCFDVVWNTTGFFENNICLGAHTLFNFVIDNNPSLLVDCPLDFTAYVDEPYDQQQNNYYCQNVPNSIRIKGSNYTGGFPPYRSALTYFNSESEALANTSWSSYECYLVPYCADYGGAPSCSGMTFEVPGATNGIYWMAIKDSLGNIKAKQVYTNCQNLPPLMTPTPTSTVTNTPSPNSSPAVTSTQTPTPTQTPSQTTTQTPTQTNTPSVTPSNTATITPTNTPSVTPSNTATITPTQTPSQTTTQTPTPTNTPSQTTTQTPSQTTTQTPTPTNTPSQTTTQTNTPSQTTTQTPTQTNTPSQTTTQTPTQTNTPSQTQTPSVTAEPTPTPTQTNTPSQTQTPSVTAEPTPTPTSNWAYYNVTQYLDCIPNSSPGAFQLRAPASLSGSWFYLGDGYQYQFDTNQTPPYSYTLEALSSSSSCIS